MNNFVKNLVQAKALRVAALSLVMTVIAGPMEAWANGNLFYNFSFLGDFGNATGQFEVQPGGGAGSFPDLVVGVTGTVSGFGVGNGSITGLLAPGTWNANTNYFSPNTPYVSGDTFFGDPGGIGFTTGTEFNITYSALDSNWIMIINDPALNSTGTLAVSLSQ
jgi:hypothetical protein